MPQIPGARSTRC